MTDLTFPQLVFFALAVIGMTHIIVDSTIIAPVRDWIKWMGEDSFNDKTNQPIKGWRLFKFFTKIIECYQCCGTWVGFLAGLCLLSYNPIIIFFAGCAGSFLAYGAAVLLTYFESQSVVTPSKEE